LRGIIEHFLCFTEINFNKIYIIIYTSLLYRIFFGIAISSFKNKRISPPIFSFKNSKAIQKDSTIWYIKK